MVTYQEGTEGSRSGSACQLQGFSDSEDAMERKSFALSSPESQILARANSQSHLGQRILSNTLMIFVLIVVK